MRSTRAARLLAVLLAFAVVAAACGDSDDDEVGTGAGEATEDAAGGETATEADGDEGGGAAEGELGQSPDDEMIYIGPAGFELDLADCPPDYDPMEGITDDTITFGLSLPKSGPLAGFGALADGSIAYFNHLNEQGGIDGRQVKIEVKDDAYEAARTRANVQEFLADPDIAGLYLTLGTPNNLAVWDQTNEECVPQLLNGTGAPHWGDVEGHPWTTGMQLDYFTEASLWGEFLKSQYPDGVTVAALVFNSDFGKSYQAGFDAAIEGSNIDLVEEALHDATAPNVDNEVTTLAATNAEVFLVETSGQFCTQAMAAVARSSWDPFVLMSFTCAGIGQFFDPLNPTGGGPHPGEGVTMMANYIDLTDPQYADLEIAKQYHEVMTAAGLDPKVSTYGTGWIFALYLEDIIRRAGTLNGGLNRPNLIIAARSQDFEHPMFIPGSGFRGKMNGAEDAYLTEGGVARQFTFQNGAGTYVDYPGVDPINVEGRAKNWDNIQELLGG